MEDEITVVTMRVIDHANPVPGTWTIPCSDCGELTWISPLWKNKKIDKIVCEHCFKEKYIDKDSVACTTEETIQLALESLKNRGIDTTREEIIEKLEFKLGKEIKIK